jgi:hypothetical protein
MKKADPNKISFKNRDIAKLTKGQKYIASQGGDPNKIEAIDFKMLKNKKRG